jgi:hypothetical protein
MAFVKHNENPKGREIGDCVIRALSKATGKSWDEVYDELYVIGKKKKRMMNDPKVYKVFLENNNFTLSPARRNECGKMISVEEFSRNVDVDTMYVIHTRKHLTVVFNGDIYDTWNTSSQRAGKFYFKQI